MNKWMHTSPSAALITGGRWVRWTVLFGGLLVGITIIVAIGATRGEAQETLLKGSFRGNAYGTHANAEAGPIAAELGRTAYQPCPCNGTGGKTRSNVVDSLSVGSGGDVLSSGVVRSTVFTDKTATSATVRNTSTVAGLNLLDGLITADAVKARANTLADASKITSNPNGSSFVNLRIDGEPVVQVQPNTTIDLPGVGSVTLKKTTKTGNGTSVSGIAVEMVVVQVDTANDLGLPVGAKIVVGHAKSGFTRAQLNAVVGGQAYAATANSTIGNDLRNRIGKAAYIVLGCEGTRGMTRTNNVEALSVDDVLRLGTGETTAFGGHTDSGTVAKTTSRVQDVKLLKVGLVWLISADTITAVAQETFENGQTSRSTEGTQFANLRVGGVAVEANVPPNTELDLPGIGSVIVNEQIVPGPDSKGRTQVNGLHITVEEAGNLLGLPVGAEIIVAHADATAKRF
jgi:hypothetical protein